MQIEILSFKIETKTENKRKKENTEKKIINSR
jgi:hypothetical protein